MLAELLVMHLAIGEPVVISIRSVLQWYDILDINNERPRRPSIYQMYSYLCGGLTFFHLIVFYLLIALVLTIKCRPVRLNPWWEVLWRARQRKRRRAELVSELEAIKRRIRFVEISQLPILDSTGAEYAPAARSLAAAAELAARPDELRLRSIAELIAECRTRMLHLIQSGKAIDAAAGEEASREERESSARIRRRVARAVARLNKAGERSNKAVPFPTMTDRPTPLARLASRRAASIGEEPSQDEEVIEIREELKRFADM